MNVADLCNGGSYWSTVKKCRPTIRRNVADAFCVSTTFVAKYEQAVIRLLRYAMCSRRYL